MPKTITPSLLGCLCLCPCWTHLLCPSASPSPWSSSHNGKLTTFLCTAENWKTWFKESIDSLFFPRSSRMRAVYRCLQPLQMLPMRGWMLCGIAGWGQHPAPEPRGIQLDWSLGNITSVKSINIFVTQEMLALFNHLIQSKGQCQFAITWPMNGGSVDFLYFLASFWHTVYFIILERTLLGVWCLVLPV